MICYIYSIIYHISCQSDRFTERSFCMWKTKDGYYRNRHSCYLLQYHLVLVTKYRHPVITGELETALKAYVTAYFAERGIPVIAFESCPDHLHILFEAPPQLNLAEFVNAFKSASSRNMRKNFARQLAPYYWKPYFWSLSYYIGSVSEQTTEVVERYIRHQRG